MSESAFLVAWNCSPPLAGIDFRKLADDLDAQATPKDAQPGAQLAEISSIRHLVALGLELFLVRSLPFRRVHVGRRSLIPRADPQLRP